MDLINKLLQKWKIQNESDLSEDEHKTVEQWKGILSKDEFTIEDIKEYCKTQINIIETKWSDYDKENSKKSELIPYHTVYRTLLQVIESPRSARENLEKHLNQLLNQ